MAGPVQNNSAAIAAAAAKRAAEEAAKQAAKQAQKQAAKEVKPEPPQQAAEKPEGDKAGGLLGAIVNGVKDAAKTMEQAAETAHKQTVKDTKKSMTEIKAELKKAESPQDIQQLADRAAKMNEKAEADGLMNPELKQDANQLNAKLIKLNEAVQLLEKSKQGLKGTVDDRAAATAELLAQGGKLEGLAGLKGTPMAEKAQKDLEAVSTEAKPETITRALENTPSIAHTIPGMAENLAALRGLGDPRLNAAIDMGASELLNQEGGLTLDEVKANPGLARLVGTSTDPALKEKLNETATTWAKDMVNSNMEGKEGEEGVEEGMEGFSAEMQELAKATGGALNEALDAGAKAAGADDDVQKKIEDVTNEGKSIFEKVTGAISGAVSGAFNGIGTVISKGFEAVGSGMELFGKVNPLNLAAKGLDAVGLDGAADLVGKGGKLMEGAYGLAGDFTKGVGDGLAGTVTGVGQMVAHPLATAKGLVHMATHPSELGAVGKALWKEASKHGIAGAIGYAAGAAAPMLLSGGSAGVGLAGKGASLVNLGSNLAGKSGMAAKLGSTVATKSGNALSHIAQTGAYTTLGNALAKPGAALANSAVGQAAIKPLAVIKDLTGGKVSDAVRQLGRPADDIKAITDANATKRLSDGAKDMGDIGKAGLNKAKEFVKDPKAVIKEAKDNRAAAKTLEAKELADAKAAMNPAGMKAQLEDIKALAKDSNKVLDADAQKKLAAKDEFKAQIAPDTLKKLEKGELDGKDAAKLERSLEAAQKLDDAYTVLKNTKGYQFTNGAVKSGAHLARIISSPLDGALGLLKIDKTRLFSKEFRDKHFDTPEGFTADRAIIAGQASQVIAISEKEQAKQSNLDKQNEKTGEHLKLK